MKDTFCMAVEALLAANGISAVSEQDEETEEPDETERT